MDKTRNGFEIAFGLSNYGNSVEMINEPQYGEIKAVLRSWNSEDEDISVKFQNVETRPCTESELGIGKEGYDSPKSKFFEADPISETWMKLYWKRL